VTKANLTAISATAGPANVIESLPAARRRYFRLVRESR